MSKTERESVQAGTGRVELTPYIYTQYQCMSETERKRVCRQGQEGWNSHPTSTLSLSVCLRLRKRESVGRDRKGWNSHPTSTPVSVYV